MEESVLFIDAMSEGNGVLVGNKLITAAHVLRGSKQFFAGPRTILTNSAQVYCDSDGILSKVTRVLYDKSSLGWRFDDYAVYAYPTKSSPLVLASDLPKIGDCLEAYSIKHTTTSSGEYDPNNIFANQTEEIFERKVDIANVLYIRGNYIFCEMNGMLEKGRSGCPLIKDGKVYGILRGGNDKNICWFQASTTIRLR